MKVLAIGDMHRKTNDVEDLLDFGLNNGYDKIVFVGDYADNFLGDAKDTFWIWATLTDQPKDVQDKIVPLMGNHDYVYAHKTEMMMIYGTEEVQSGFDPITSVGVDFEYQKYLKEHLPIYVEIDGVLYSHAGFSQKWYDRWMRREDYRDLGPLDQVRALFGKQYSPLWQRPGDGYLSMTKIDKETGEVLRALRPSPYPYHKKQVFGHTPVLTCTDLHKNGKVWCIDTFSQHRSGDSIGDRSILEIIDGKKFRVIYEKEWSKK